MGGLKIEKTKEWNVTLHPKFLVQGMPSGENDINSTFVLCGSKSSFFSNPSEFA